MVNCIFIIKIIIYDQNASIYTLNDAISPPVHLLTPSRSYILVGTIIPQYILKGQVFNVLIWNVWSIFVFVSFVSVVIVRTQSLIKRSSR